MDMQIRAKAKAFLLKYHISKVNAESLKHALESQGFSIIRFNNIQNTPDVDRLTAITPYSDGLTLQFGSKSYNLLLPDSETANNAINLLI